MARRQRNKYHSAEPSDCGVKRPKAAPNLELTGDNIKIDNTTYGNIVIKSSIPEGTTVLTSNPAFCVVSSVTSSLSGKVHFEYQFPNTRSEQTGIGAALATSNILTIELWKDANNDDKLAAKADSLKKYLFGDGKESYYGDVVDNPEIAPTKFANPKTTGLYGCVRRVVDISSQTEECNNEKDENGLYKKMHSGIDIAAVVGTDLKAVAGGKVDKINGSVDDETGAGLRVYIKSNDENGNPIYYGYCHLSEVLVSKDEMVIKGQIIAKSGASGNANNVDVKHCHLIVYDKNFINQIDPQPFIKSKFDSNGNRIIK